LRHISAICSLSTLLLSVAFSSALMFGQDTLSHVYADRKNQAHIVYTSGKDVVIAAERGQIGIASIQTAGDGQIAGWLVLYADPDGGSPVAGTLVLWRAGKIIRRFQSDQTFWSWALYAHARQVAYHVGPTHGETVSRCELHDIESGHLVASWDGDLDDPARPPWTKGLDH
jgi:hypothetical protein